MSAAKNTNGLAESLPSLLGTQAQNIARSAGRLAVSTVADRLGKTTERLTEYAANGGGKGLMSAVTGGDGENPVGSVLTRGVGKVKQALGGNGNSGANGKDLKVTNIVEQLDIGAPVRVCYDQWTQFADFPKFMKKVETVEQESDEKLTWRAQVWWSHRMWQSTIVEQVPDRRIVWRSSGDKGYVDGAVTFHELAPELTRMMVILEYHPKGFVEKTANIWRAQGRRARLELKHFARHVMTQAVLHPEEMNGWRGEIHDSKVVRAKAKQKSPRDGKSRASEPEDKYDKARDRGSTDDD